MTACLLVQVVVNKNIDSMYLLVFWIFSNTLRRAYVLWPSCAHMHIELVSCNRQIVTVVLELSDVYVQVPHLREIPFMLRPGIGIMRFQLLHMPSIFRGVMLRSHNLCDADRAVMRDDERAAAGVIGQMRASLRHGCSERSPCCSSIGLM